MKNRSLLAYPRLAPVLFGVLLGACEGKSPAPTAAAATDAASPITAMTATSGTTPIAVAKPTPPPAMYELDVSHSRLEFSVRHMMASNTRGQFGKFSGTAFIDEGSPRESKVNLDIVASTIDSSDPKRDEHLRSADFFDVKRFPQITFRSTGVERVGDGWKVVGDLTIRDVTKPVVLDVDALSPAVKDPWGGTRRGTRARAKIDRKAFGLTWNKALEAGGVAVGDEVTLDFEIELLQKKTS